MAVLEASSADTARTWCPRRRDPDKTPRQYAWSAYHQVRDVSTGVTFWQRVLETGLRINRPRRSSDIEIEYEEPIFDENFVDSMKVPARIVGRDVETGFRNDAYCA